MKLLKILLLLPLLLMLSACLDSLVKPEAAVDTGLETQLPAYSGPRAMAAITEFEWKVGGSKSTIGIGGTDLSFSTTEYEGISSGLKDMLTTALVQSKRYRVLEPREIEAVTTEFGIKEDGITVSSGVDRGQDTGAEIAVIAAVTGFDPGSSGSGGTVGGLLGGKAASVLGALSGGYNEASMAMDIRIVDRATREVLAATRVESVAKDVNIGAALGALAGTSSLGGSLGGYAKTPMEKAIRTSIYEAAMYIIENTPERYMRHQ